MGNCFATFEECNNVAGNYGQIHIEKQRTRLLEINMFCQAESFIILIWSLIITMVPV